MNTRQPPLLATRLLQQLVFLQNRDALAGDLIEQFRNGRSAAWYWRQTFMAIVTSSWSDMRRSPAMAIRVIVFGYAVSEAFMYSTGAVVARVMSDNNTELFALLPTGFLCAVAAGWIIERTHSASLLIVFVWFIWGASVITFGVYAWLPYMDRVPASTPGSVTHDNRATGTV